MARNISFFLTTPQFVAGIKTVTRRMAWYDLKVGQELMAVEKAQGLGKGGKIRRLGLIRVVDLRWEPLDRLMECPYGYDETAKEGFPHPHELHDPCSFIEFFCAGHKGCMPRSEVHRIEFERLA